MKKAFITGITGQDGSYLTRYLLDKDYKVYGLVRDSEINNLNNLKYLKIIDRVVLVKGDVTSMSSVRTLLESIGPDEIYNLVAQSSVANSFTNPSVTVKFNVITTLNLLESLRVLSLDAKFYQASSSEMYGKVKSLPVVEDSVLHPLSPYAISKATGHWLAINYREVYGLFCCCGILFNHESILRPSNYVTKKVISTAVRISKGSKEKLVLGNVQVKRDWGYAPEYIKSMWLMLQQDEPNEYVIATNKAYSLKEFVKYTFECLNLHWEEHTVIDEKLFRPSDIDIIYGNPAKAKTSLGWIYNLTFKELIHLLVEEELSLQDHKQQSNSVENN